MSPPAAPDLPPPPRYACMRAHTPPVLTGELTGAEWQRAAWTGDFLDIRGPSGPAPPYATRAKLLWDPSYLYVGAHLEDDAVWGTITEPNTPIFMDNDMELFLDPDADGRNYYELELNALGTTWQLSLDRSYITGGRARSPHMLEGLRTAVHVHGRLNDPTVRDTGWSAVMAVPMAELAQFGAGVPVKGGDVWRMNMSRVHWQHRVVDGQYVRVPPHGTPLPQGSNQWHPERNLVWAPTGEVNVHIPDRWGFLQFVE